MQDKNINGQPEPKKKSVDEILYPNIFRMDTTPTPMSPEEKELSEKFDATRYQVGDGYETAIKWGIDPNKAKDMTMAEADAAIVAQSSNMGDGVKYATQIATKGLTSFGRAALWAPEAFIGGIMAFGNVAQSLYNGTIQEDWGQVFDKAVEGFEMNPISMAFESINNGVTNSTEVYVPQANKDFDLFERLTSKQGISELLNSVAWSFGGMKGLMKAGTVNNMLKKSIGLGEKNVAGLAKMSGEVGGKIVADVLENPQAIVAQENAGNMITKYFKDNAKNIKFGTIQRANESLTESLQTYHETVQTALDNGFSEEDARAMASRTFATSFGLNMLLTPLEIMQTKLLFEGWSGNAGKFVKYSGGDFVKQSGKITAAKVAEVGGSMIWEGAGEENLQKALNDYLVGIYSNTNILNSKTEHASVSQLLSSVFGNYINNFNTEDGRYAITQGSLGSFIQSGLFLKSKINKENKDVQETIDRLNNVKDTFESAKKRANVLMQKLDESDSPAKYAAINEELQSVQAEILELNKAYSANMTNGNVDVDFGVKTVDKLNSLFTYQAFLNLATGMDLSNDKLSNDLFVAMNSANVMSPFIMSDTNEALKYYMYEEVDSIKDAGERVARKQVIDDKIKKYSTEYDNIKRKHEDLNLSNNEMQYIFNEHVLQTTLSEHLKDAKTEALKFQGTDLQAIDVLNQYEKQLELARNTIDILERDQVKDIAQLEKNKSKLADLDKSGDVDSIDRKQTDREYKDLLNNIKSRSTLLSKLSNDIDSINTVSKDQSTDKTAIQKALLSLRRPSVMLKNSHQRYYEFLKKKIAGITGEKYVAPVQQQALTKEQRDLSYTEYSKDEPLPVQPFIQSKEGEATPSSFIKQTSNVITKEELEIIKSDVGEKLVASDGTILGQEFDATNTVESVLLKISTPNKDGVAIQYGDNIILVYHDGVSLTIKESEFNELEKNAISKHAIWRYFPDLKSEFINDSTLNVVPQAQEPIIVPQTLGTAQAEEQPLKTSNIASDAVTSVSSFEYTGEVVRFGNADYMVIAGNRNDFVNENIDNELAVSLAIESKFNNTAIDADVTIFTNINEYNFKDDSRKALAETSLSLLEKAKVNGLDSLTKDELQSLVAHLPLQIRNNNTLISQVKDGSVNDDSSELYNTRLNIIKKHLAGDTKISLRVRRINRMFNAQNVGGVNELTLSSTRTVLGDIKQVDYTTEPLSQGAIKIVFHSGKYAGESFILFPATVTNESIDALQKALKTQRADAYIANEVVTYKDKVQKASGIYIGTHISGLHLAYYTARDGSINYELRKGNQVIYNPDIDDRTLISKYNYNLDLKDVDLDRSLMGLVPGKPLGDVVFTIEANTVSKPIVTPHVEPVTPVNTNEVQASVSFILQGFQGQPQKIRENNFEQHQVSKSLINKVAATHGLKVVYENNPNGVYAYVKSGVIYLNEAYGLSSDTLVHEISHPIISVIKESNPNLWKALKNEIDKSADGRDMMVKVANAYSELDNEGHYIESAAQLIGKSANGLVQNRKLDSWLKMLWNQIKSFFNKLFGTDVTKLSANTKIADIADIILSGRVKNDLTVDEEWQSKRDTFDKLINLTANERTQLKKVSRLATILLTNGKPSGFRMYSNSDVSAIEQAVSSIIKMNGFEKVYSPESISEAVSIAIDDMSKFGLKYSNAKDINVEEDEDEDTSESPNKEKGVQFSSSIDNKISLDYELFATLSLIPNTSKIQDSSNILNGMNDYKDFNDVYGTVINIFQNCISEEEAIERLKLLISSSDNMKGYSKLLDKIESNSVFRNKLFSKLFRFEYNMSIHTDDIMYNPKYFKSMNFFVQSWRNTYNSITEHNVKEVEGIWQDVGDRIPTILSNAITRAFYTYSLQSSNNQADIQFYNEKLAELNALNIDSDLNKMSKMLNILGFKLTADDLLMAELSYVAASKQLSAGRRSFNKVLDKSNQLSNIKFKSIVDAFLKNPKSFGNPTSKDANSYVKEIEKMGYIFSTIKSSDLDKTVHNVENQKQYMLNFFNHFAFVAQNMKKNGRAFINRIFGNDPLASNLGFKEINNYDRTEVVIDGGRKMQTRAIPYSKSTTLSILKNKIDYTLRGLYKDKRNQTFLAPVPGDASNYYMISTDPIFKSNDIFTEEGRLSDKSLSKLRDIWNADADSITLAHEEVEEAIRTGNYKFVFKGVHYQKEEELSPSYNGERKGTAYQMQFIGKGIQEFSGRYFSKEDISAIKQLSEDKVNEYVLQYFTDLVKKNTSNFAKHNIISRSYKQDAVTKQMVLSNTYSPNSWFKEIIGDNSVRNAIGAYTLMTIYGYANTISIMSGSPIFYKSYAKRQKQQGTGGIQVEKSYGKSSAKFAVFDDISLKDDGESSIEAIRNGLVASGVNQSVIDKIIKTYEDSKITDGYAFCTIQRYKQLIEKKGATESDLTIINKIINGTATNEDYNNLNIYPIKGLYSGSYKVTTNGKDRMVPVLIKYAVVPVLPKRNDLTTYKFAYIHSKMNDLGVDEILFSSASKLDTMKSNGKLSLESLKDNGIEYIYELDNADYRIVTETGYHDYTEGKLSVQVKRIAFSDLKQDVKYNNGMTGKQILDSALNVLSDMTNTQGDKFYRELLIEKIQEAIDSLQEANKLSLQSGAFIIERERQAKRELMQVISDSLKIQISKSDVFADNLIKALEIMPNGEFKYSLAHPSVIETIEKIVLSGVKRDVFTLHCDGIRLINRPSIMFDSETLKFTEPIIKDGVVVGNTPAEIMISQDYFINMLRQQGVQVEQYFQDGQIDINKIPSGLREVFIIREPNQAKNSSLFCYITKFLDRSSSTQIVVSREMVAQSGIDFDKDESFLMFKPMQFNTTTGMFERSDKPDAENKRKYFDLIKAVYTSGHNYADIVSPNNAWTLEKIASKKQRQESINILNDSDATTQTTIQNVGKELVGIASIATTGNTMFQYAMNMTENKSLSGYTFKFDDKEIGLTDDITKDASGILVSSNFMELGTVAVDNSNNPVCGYLNFNQDTMFWVCCMTQFGVPLKTIAMLTTQPSLVKLMSDYGTNDLSYYDKQKLVEDSIKFYNKQITNRGFVEFVSSNKGDNLFKPFYNMLYTDKLEQFADYTEEDKKSDEYYMYQREALVRYYKDNFGGIVGEYKSILNHTRLDVKPNENSFIENEVMLSHADISQVKMFKVSAFSKLPNVNSVEEQVYDRSENALNFLLGGNVIVSKSIFNNTINLLGTEKYVHTKFRKAVISYYLMANADNPISLFMQENNINSIEELNDTLKTTLASVQQELDTEKKLRNPIRILMSKFVNDIWYDNDRDSVQWVLALEKLSNEEKGMYSDAIVSMLQDKNKNIRLLPKLLFIKQMVDGGLLKKFGDMSDVMPIDIFDHISYRDINTGKKATLNDYFNKFLENTRNKEFDSVSLQQALDEFVINNRGSNLYKYVRKSDIRAIGSNSYEVKFAPTIIVPPILYRSIEDSETGFTHMAYYKHVSGSIYFDENHTYALYEPLSMKDKYVGYGQFHRLSKATVEEVSEPQQAPEYNVEEEQDRVKAYESVANVEQTPVSQARAIAEIPNEQPAQQLTSKQYYEGDIKPEQTPVSQMSIDKESKNEINELFKSNKQLAAIGNEDEYYHYLNSIFPNSKINKILYHGTIIDFNKFSKSKLGLNTKANSAYQGFFFTDNKLVANSYLNKDTISRQNIKYDINNDLIKEYGLLNDISYLNEKIEQLKTLIEENKNNVYGLEPKIEYYYSSNSYIMFDDGVLYKESYDVDTRKYTKQEISPSDSIDRLLKRIRSDYSNRYIRKYDNEYLKDQLQKLEYVKDLYEQGEELPNLKIEFYWEPQTLFNTRLFLNNYISDKYSRISTISYKKPSPAIKKVILNISNPKVYDYNGKTNRNITYDEVIKTTNRDKFDGVIMKNTFDAGLYKEDRFLSDIFIAFEPEQIHILGSKEDVESFSSWKEKQPTSPLKIEGFIMSNPEIVGFTKKEADTKLRDHIAKKTGLDKTTSEGKFFGKDTTLYDNYIKAASVASEQELQNILKCL